MENTHEENNVAWAVAVNPQASARYYTNTGGYYAFTLNRNSDYLRRWRNLFLGHRKVRQ
jgi:hypothetical protein